MPKVAVEGDVTATAGSAPYPPAVTGAWSPTPVNYTSYPKFSVDSTSVIHTATCLFVFSGADSSGSPVAGTETVTLTASTTKWQGSLANVLVHGDSAIGSFGNKLEVRANGSATTQ
ncbi:MAG: hypothetical protein RIT81_16515 [Deltaproteobacteria bacterium]